MGKRKTRPESRTNVPRGRAAGKENPGPKARRRTQGGARVRPCGKGVRAGGGTRQGRRGGAPDGKRSVEEEMSTSHCRKQRISCEQILYGTRIVVTSCPHQPFMCPA